MYQTLEELIGAEDAARVIEFRHDLHRHPEIGMDTARTAEKIEAFLATLPVDHVERVERNGVVAVVRGQKEGPMIGLRGDIDALPIQDETHTGWESTVPGCAHLCGHDGHGAGILATAIYLTKHRDFAGSVALIFQPGEEGFAGAQHMIEDGLFKKFPCREVFGIHGDPTQPVGVISFRDGAMCASADIAEMVVEGKGGHGARPHETIDPMPATANLLTALQTIVSRNVDPNESAVVSCCYIHAGDPQAPTVIPQRVTLSATVRTFNTAIQDMIEKRFNEICAGIGATYNCKVTLNYKRVYPAQINDAPLARETMRILGDVMGTEAVRTVFPPAMGSEDFAFMTNALPGVYMKVGLGDAEHTALLHNPGFDFNDRALGVSVTAFTAIVKARLPL